MEEKTRNCSEREKNSPGGGRTAVTEYINSFFPPFPPIRQYASATHIIISGRDGKGHRKKGREKKNIIDSARGTYRKKIPPTPTDLIRTSVGITRHTETQKNLSIQEKKYWIYSTQEQLTRSLRKRRRLRGGYASRFPGSGPPRKCGNVL